MERVIIAHPGYQPYSFGIKHKFSARMNYYVQDDKKTIFLRLKEYILTVTLSLRLPRPQLNYFYSFSLFFFKRLTYSVLNNCMFLAVTQWFTIP